MWGGGWLPDIKFNSSYTYMDWFMPFCEKIRANDLSEVPSPFNTAGNQKYYNAYCTMFHILTINAKVEAADANFRGGTKWYSSVLTAPIVTNVPSYLTADKGMLQNLADATVTFNQGPWKDGVDKTKPNDDISVGVDLHEFHIANSMDNLAYTGLVPEFTKRFEVSRRAWDYYGVDPTLVSETYYPTNEEPETVFDKTLGAVVPKHLAQSDVALIPYTIAHSVMYKKQPASCTFSFRLGMSALEKIYKLVESETCRTVEEMSELARSLTTHFGTKRKWYAPFADRHNDNPVFAIPVYYYDEWILLSKVFKSIECELEEKLKSYGCELDLEVMNNFWDIGSGRPGLIGGTPPICENSVNVVTESIAYSGCGSGTINGGDSSSSGSTGGSSSSGCAM